VHSSLFLYNSTVDLRLGNCGAFYQVQPAGVLSFWTQCHFEPS
jgi:hypothetical protein